MIVSLTFGTEALKTREEAKFKAADANGDGFLDATEFVHYNSPEHHDKVLQSDWL